MQIPPIMVLLSSIATTAISHCPHLDHHPHLKAWLDEQRTLQESRCIQQQDRDYERKVYREVRQRRKAAERKEKEKAYIRLLISEGYFGEHGEGWKGTRAQWESVSRNVHIVETV